MACYHPIPAWRTRGGDITFRAGHGVGLELKLPCGQCIGCRLERSRQWAMRCVYESKLHSSNCFVTLTYDDDHLPEHGGLVKRDGQNFVKRLRKRFRDKRIRFFLCGEYGDQLGRPHYHAIIFGHDFSDKKLFSERGGVKCYTSDELSKLWRFGFSTVGDVTFESAAYVARYCVKKVTGKGASEYYKRVNVQTGEIYEIEPEYTTMSLKPGVGAEWFAKFCSDVFPSDYLVVNGHKVRPPRFFDKLFERDAAADFERVKRRRVRTASRFRSDQTPERLKVREQVSSARLMQLKRHKEI